MAFDKTKPTNNGLIINLPGGLRSNWDAIEARIDSALMITNAMCHASMALADSKLATITTASKVHGTAIANLGGIPSSAGAFPVANLVNAVTRSGAQTIADVKTFTSFPLTPSSAPTTSYQAANKKYVDTGIFYVGEPTTLDTYTAGGTGAELARLTVYQASCDGELHAQFEYMSDNSSAIQMYLGDAADSLSIYPYYRANTNSGSWRGMTGQVIVKKGQYFKFGTGTSSIGTKIYFVPLEAI